MANFSITVQSSLRAFGPAPADTFGTTAPNSFLWGTTRWGEGTQDLATQVQKLTTTSMSPDSAMSLNPTVLLEVINNSLSTEFEMSSEGMQDGSGYNYVFVEPTIEAENRALTSFAAYGGPSNTWTPAARGSTPWS